MPPLRKTTLAVAGVAMLGSSLQFLRPGISPSDQTGKQQSEIASTATRPVNPQSSVGREEDSPAVALCDYFRTQPDNAPRDEIEHKAEITDKEVKVIKPVTTGKEADPFGCVKEHEAYKGGAEFLISTVPDPINSHLALEYDRSLESIERAATQAAYTFDRYWLPWNDTYTKPQEDLEKARNTERQRRLREEEPGVLIFHRRDDQKNSDKGASPKSRSSPELLIVFLVGETPSHGLNKISLRKALSYTAGLESKMQLLPESSEIKIAGPNLSASLHSMAILFREMQSDVNSPLPPISIISGSASNPDAITEFNNTIGKNGPVTFQSLAHDDKRQLKPIICQLHRITGAKASEIGVIAETASGYGGLVERSSNGSNSAGRSPDINNDCSGNNGNNPDSDGDCGGPNPDSNGDCSRNSNLNVLWLQFPRDMAPLRNAYQATQDSLAAAKSKQANQLPQVNLPLSYGELETHERDYMPALSQGQTPVSQDAIMQQIAQTLRERKIKTVVLYATSALDNLFLLQYLREHTPNIRVALPQADLLYIRSGEPKDFTGTIVFSDYPLFISSTVLRGNKQPAYADTSSTLADTQSEFASTQSESLFFSVLASLRPEMVYENPPATGSLSSRQVWMGVLGKTAYWPVRFLVPVPHASDLEDAPTRLFKAQVFFPPSPGWLWYFFLALINVAAAVHCWAVITASKSPRDKKWWREYYAIDHEGRGEHQRARACYLLLASINVAIAQAVVLAPSLRLYQATHTRPLAWFCGVFLIVFICSMYVIAFTAEAAKGGCVRSGGSGSKPENPHDRNHEGGKGAKSRNVAKEVHWISRAIVAICQLAFVAVLVSWAWLCFGRDGLYFSYRAAFLLSGVCPTLPALFVALGVYSYAMGSMRRITYFQYRFASFPNDFNNVLYSDFRQLQNDLTCALSPDTVISFFQKTPITLIRISKNLQLTLGSLIVAMALGGGILLALLRIGPSSVEGRLYDITVLAGTYAIWVSLLGTALRFWFVWEVSNKMLRRLERQPLRYAFNRIPGLFAWTPVWRLGGIKRSMLVQSRSVEYLRCLGGSRRENDDDALEHELLVPGKDLKNVEKKLNAMLFLEAKGRRITHQPACDLDKALCDMANKLTTYLAPIWQDGGADSASQEGCIRRKDLPKGPGWRSDHDHRVMLAAEFVALRFVAVIRYISLQMRNMLAMMSFGFVLLVLALESYPFQPRERISWWILGTFIGLGASILYIFRGLSNDLILKRLTAARPGKLDIAIIWPALKFGVLPILTVLASQFPALSNFLFSWIEPALDSLH